ncbi:unnamed protein product [Ixodes hexagonus]
MFFSSFHLARIRGKYRECLEQSSRETACDFKVHALSRLRTLTALLKRDYGILCDGQSVAQKELDHNNHRPARHQSCRERGFLKAIEKCDHVFEDDAVLLKENVIRASSIRTSFVIRAKEMICL